MNKLSKLELSTPTKLLPLKIHRDHLSQAIESHLRQFGYMKEDNQFYILDDISFEGDVAMVNGRIGIEHGS